MRERPIDKVFDVMGIIGILLCLYLLLSAWLGNSDGDESKDSVQTQALIKTWNEGG